MNPINKIDLVNSFFNLSLDSSTHLTNATNSSKDITEGSIFFALQGTTEHGIKYSTDAISKGASVVLSDKELQYKNSHKVFYIPNLQSRIKDFLFKYYMIDKMQVLFFGFTGTNGKTSSAFLTYQLLETYGREAAYFGTIGFQSKDIFVKSPTTTPSIFFLFENLKDINIQDKLYVVLELSSHALDQNRLYDLHFNKTGILNITSDHLDYHRTKEAYQLSKLKALNIKSDSKPLIDKSVVPIIRKHDYDSKGFEMVGLNNPDGRFNVNIYQYSPQGSEVTIHDHLSDRQTSFTSKIFPTFNLYNLSFAICMLFDHLPFTEEITDLNHIKLPIGRNTVLSLQDKSVVIDFAHNPEAFLSILHAYSKFYKRIWIVFGCGGERDKTKRPIMFDIANNFCERIFFTSDNSRSESFKSILQDTTKNIKYKKLTVIEDRDQAIHDSISMLPKKVPLLILGRGHETELNMGNELIKHSDIEASQKYLDI